MPCGAGLRTEVGARQLTYAIEKYHAVGIGIEYVIILLNSTERKANSPLGVQEESLLEVGHAQEVCLVVAIAVPSEKSVGIAAGGRTLGDLHRLSFD
jgi:hypothetical protein